MKHLTYLCIILLLITSVSAHRYRFVIDQHGPYNVENISQYSEQKLRWQYAQITIKHAIQNNDYEDWVDAVHMLDKDYDASPEKFDRIVEVSAAKKLSKEALLEKDYEKWLEAQEVLGYSKVSEERFNTFADWYIAKKNGDYTRAKTYAKNLRSSCPVQEADTRFSF